MEILSSRILLRPSDLERSHAFYRDALGLAVHREFGSGEHHGLVFALGGGFLEVSGRGDGDGSVTSLWLQVRDAAAAVAEIAARGVPVVREVRTEPWGLVEGWIEDPDGVRIVIVQVPDDHPLRLDQR